MTIRRRRRPIALFALTALAALGAAPGTASAANLLRGLGGLVDLGEGSLRPGDDESSAAIDITPAFPSGLRFFGMTFTQLYVNNNGNISFGAAVGAYTPRPFPTASRRMIAPWWGDVDTTGGGRPDRNGVYWDISPGRFVATWNLVGYFSAHVNKLNNFQLILTAAPGCAGNFNVEFRYQRCEWTTGDASGGTNGLGGTEAQAGFDAGDQMNFYTLPGSRSAAVLNLCTTSNVGMPGVYRFTIRGGELPCDGGGGSCMTTQPGVCAPGTTQCRANVPTCVADVAASAERCDGLDNDCNGMVDEGTTLCPAGQTCDRAVCVPRCVEDSCFDGQTCTARGTCVETACATVACAPGQRCEAGRCVGACDGIRCPQPSVCRAGRCVDPCAGVTCDMGNVCENGVCRAACGCRACPAGQACRADGRCAPTACATVNCAAGTYCNAGACADSCAGAVCPRGERCERGACVGAMLPDAGATEDAAVMLGDVGVPSDSGGVITDDAAVGLPDASVPGTDGGRRDGGTTPVMPGGCACRTVGSVGAPGDRGAGAGLLGAAALAALLTGGRRRRGRDVARHGGR